MKEHGKSREPVMKTTNYEKTSSLLMAVVSGLTILVFVLVVQLQFHESYHSQDKKTIIDPVPGGSPSRHSLELAGVESPEEQEDLSLIAKTQLDLEKLIDEKTIGTLPTESSDAKTNPQKGNEGGCGYGKKQAGVLPGAGQGDGDRWFIAFADNGSLQNYAKQLDFFNIEIAYWNPDTKSLTYVNHFSREKPTSRVVKGVKDKRLFFLWQNDDRRAADVQLLQKAGVDVTHGVIVHFYPDATKRILAETESAKTHRPLSEIRRTYFGVRTDGAGFKFVVTRISYLESP